MNITHTSMVAQMGHLHSHNNAIQPQCTRNY